MSVGTWTRFSAVPVRSLYRRPQSRQQKRRKPWTVRPSRSQVDDEWQCGQSMTALLITQNQAREPICWERSRQAAPRSDRTRQPPPAPVPCTSSPCPAMPRPGARSFGVPSIWPFSWWNTFGVLFRGSTFRSLPRSVPASCLPWSDPIVKGFPQGSYQFE